MRNVFYTRLVVLLTAMTMGASVGERKQTSLSSLFLLSKGACRNCVGRVELLQRNMSVIVTIYFASLCELCR